MYIWVNDDVRPIYFLEMPSIFFSASCASRLVPAASCAGSVGMAGCSGLATGPPRWALIVNCFTLFIQVVISGVACG